MGIIIGKFRKKPTTYEILDKLENEIQRIEEFRRDTERTQKKMVGRFVVISICVYCISAFIFYFYFFPASLYERLIYIIPLLMIPIILVFIKRILSWYYSRQITKNESKLTNLKDEKKKILEDVMDKETYKVAQKILEKFAPEQIRKSTPYSTPLKMPSNALVTQTTDLRRRTLGSHPSAISESITPLSYRPPLHTTAPRTLHSKLSNLNSQQLPSSVRKLVPSSNITTVSTPLPLPRAILPRDRTVLDKMVDYLVGDGPSNRYALICKECFSHNGMALKEEFDYLSFRCCYCSTFNPARKQRPIAPKLEMSQEGNPNLSGAAAVTTGAVTQSSESADSDSEPEPEPAITAIPDVPPLVTRGQSERPDVNVSKSTTPENSRRTSESSEQEVNYIEYPDESRRSSDSSEEGGPSVAVPPVTTKVKTDQTTAKE